MTEPVTGPGAVASAEPAGRPMGAIYIAVVIVEILTLLALWWFQRTFGING